MSWLLFQMNLKPSDELLAGKLSIMEGDLEKESFLVTSGLAGCQTLDHQSARGMGPIPACKKVGISNYSVLTTPYDRRATLGIEGNFYYIQPDPVDVPPLRGEFGIHFDANGPGSAGCVVFRRRKEWEAFQEFMLDYNRNGCESISLIVEYNTSRRNHEGEAPGTSYFTVTSPQPGANLKTRDSIQFAGTAKNNVAKIIAEVGPGGPFKIGEVTPESNEWCFTQSLITPGVSRPFSFRAFDSDGNFLQKVAFNLTLSSGGSGDAIKISFRGKMSTFGGPSDTGMELDEGLALIQRYEDLPDYFIRPPRPGEGLGRLLNPQKYYLACRWDYRIVRQSELVNTMVIVSNPKNGLSAEAKPVDWGPADWTERVADLSPGLAEHLGLKTDDHCVIELTIPRG